MLNDVRYRGKVSAGYRGLLPRIAAKSSAGRFTSTSASVALSLALTGIARSLLFGLEPHDAGTLAAAVGALALIALVASPIPARRAVRVDPMRTLKED